MNMKRIKTFPFPRKIASAVYPTSRAGSGNLVGNEKECKEEYLASTLFLHSLFRSRTRKCCLHFFSLGGTAFQCGNPDWRVYDEGTGLDDFYRRALSQGLVYHEAIGRGLLPAGLIEEILALARPPIPRDVELAESFDEHSPLWRCIVRTLAPADDNRPHPISLSPLGAVASYSVSRDVPTAGAIFCDAATYD